MIYIVHHFDASDSLNTRTTNYHTHLSAAQAQYNMHVTTSEDFCKVELVGLEPNMLTEHIIQEDILNG
jgi:hypothetical protein